MRLASIDTDEGPVAAVLLGEDLVPVSTLDAPATTVRGLLAALDAEGLRELQARAENADERTALADAKLLRARHRPAEDRVPRPELPRSRRRDRPGDPDRADVVREVRQLADRQRAGDRAPARAPRVRRLRGRARARDRQAGAKRRQSRTRSRYVAGAMPFNDVSARDLQLQNPLWTSGKAIDTFAPCGPALVTLDEIADLQDLGLRTRIDGELVQEGTTANLDLRPRRDRGMALTHHDAAARRHHRHGHARGRRRRAGTVPARRRYGRGGNRRARSGA